MALLALLPRAVASRACHGRAGRPRPLHGAAARTSARPAFVSAGPAALAHHRRPLRGGGRPAGVSVARFATASPSGGERTEPALRKQTVKELKERLREEGLPTSGAKAELVERLAGRGGAAAPRQEQARPKKPPPSPKRKFTINPNWQTEFNAKALTDKFDKMAKDEGFDATTAFFADDATFEEDFTEEDYALDAEDDREEVDGDAPDPGASPARSMDERVASARRDSALGRAAVSRGLAELSQGSHFDALRQLGFRQEANPWGDDETPRREQFKIITGSLSCSGCGADFQTDSDLKPGFLPADKFATQEKLALIEEAQKKLDRAESVEWSPDDEVDWLLKQNEPAGEEEEPGLDLSNLSVEEMAGQLDLDPEALSQKKVICQRCHGLQNHGQVAADLRPGWTDEPALSQEEFRKLLLPLRQKKAVILALVDLFDFSGSVLAELDQIAGDNPVILAANKADLLPSEMGQTRAENWVRRELEHLNVQSIANIGGAVRLVSCKTGFGVNKMMEKAKALADDMDCDIYVVGAANAGKSTLVNRILDEAAPKRAKYGGKKRAGNQNKWKGSVTTSPLPGTTLKFIQIKLGGGRHLYDTPGLLVPGCLTERLTSKELAIVVPKKQVEPITFRIAAGKCALVGGLARIELVGDSKPFLFTFFVANDIKLHLTDAAKADEFTAKHAGTILTPPLDPGPERLAEIGEFEYHDIDIDGDGWKQAAADITLRGLGWVAVTGAGRASVRIGVPKGIGIAVRPPLMPFDVWAATAKYTGGRAVRKSGKSRSGKRRRGVGRN